MKKIFVLGFWSLIILLFTTCNSNKRSIKIGFLVRGFVIDRCKIEKDFFLEKAKQLGCEVIVADGKENDELQISQGTDLLKQGIDVLVIFPVNQITSAAIVREANKEKVPVIAYESLIQNCDLDYFISANNGKGGELMAQYILQITPKGEYIILGGDKTDRNAVLIKEGIEKVLKPQIQQGSIHVFYNIYASWYPEEGYVETKRAINLSGSFPDAIICSNDGLATGAIRALKEFDKAGKIPVTGLDAELSACRRVAEGTQTLTIYKSFKKQAYTAAEMAYQIANGKKPEQINATSFNHLKNVPSCLIEPVLVNSENMNKIIIEEKVFKKEEIFGIK